MRKIISLLLLLCTLVAFGQRPQKPMVTITGKVIDKLSNQPLEYATVVLKNSRTKKVSGGITNEKGVFSIKTSKGIYDISFEFISFKTKKLPKTKILSDKNFGTIILAEDSESLDEISIIAEKSTVEIRLDKKIYNVGKDMTVKGGTASDVLDNVPSVNVDVDGAVSLRGNENVRILIDGKPSALAGLGGTDALRNLPADAIEKVEVITSPSARYDAEGTAGILNIILRKGKITGFNGSVNVSVGNPDMFRIAPNLNFRTKKINLFSNIGYSYRNGPGNADIDITNFNNGVITDFRTEDRIYQRKRNGFNGSLGLEYYLTKNSSITGQFVYRNSDGDDLATNFIQNLDPNKTILETFNRVENELEDDITKQYSINYTNNFKQKGKKLTIDLQYSDSNESELATITSNAVLAENNSQITTEKRTLFQIDYVLPIGEDSQFEIGQRTNLEDVSSDFRVRDSNGNPFVFDPSNNINFKQNIYAFYAQYGSKINKFSYLLGLRSETTNFDLLLINTNELSKKNYTEFFPTVNFGYEINDSDNLTFGISRRLRRPRSWFLNPFETRNSDTYIFKGNPDLNPTFTSSFDLGYTTKINKLTLNSSIYYQRSKNNFQFVTREEIRDIGGVNTPVQLRQPINLSSEDRYGFEFTSNYNPSRKVRLTGSFNFFNFKTDGDFTYTNSIGQVKTQNFDAKNSSWFTRFNARITLPAKIQWQTSFMFRGSQETAQSNRKGVPSISLALSKDLFKEKASLVLNVSDLLNSRKRISETFIPDRDNPNSITNQEFQWRQRQITLSFTYRFNQKKKRERSRGRNYDDGGGGEFGG